MYTSMLVNKKISIVLLLISKIDHVKSSFFPVKKAFICIDNCCFLYYSLVIFWNNRKKGTRSESFSHFISCWMYDVKKSVGYVPWQFHSR